VIVRRERRGGGEGAIKSDERSQKDCSNKYGGMEF
jgi:hypothetical protein